MYGEIGISHKFTDNRGREWERFLDESYFGMICVRLTTDRQFDSPTSFHFISFHDAAEFCKLIQSSM